MVTCSQVGGSLRIILVGPGEAEQSADTVPHVSLDEPTVVLHRPGHGRDALTDQGLDFLRRDGPGAGGVALNVTQVSWC